MSDFDSLKDDLKKARDEILLKLHLASMEVKDEWREVEGKWQSFTERAEVHRSADGLSDAMVKLGDELKVAFQRIRKAI
jgi:hypothetical protein